MHLYQGSNVIDGDLDDNFKFQGNMTHSQVAYINLNVAEYQTVLGRADNLWIRINATTFNESIVFSGIGQQKIIFLLIYTSSKKKK